MKFLGFFCKSIGEKRNNGFKLHTNGHGKTYWKKISSEENTNKPKITVSYHYEDSPKPTVTVTAYMMVQIMAILKRNRQGYKFYHSKGYKWVWF